MLQGIGEVFRKDQLDAISLAQLRLVEDGREETKPVALLPLVRDVD